MLSFSFINLLNVTIAEHLWLPATPIHLNLC